ncbi:MAG TPA: hypothetical protein VEU54_05245 [Steroidobacteraceae bacterium]|nr:hypothetical protein [Steroidobacteraceae bacterium]
MTPQPQRAAGAGSGAEAAEPTASGAGATRFVLNLCSSTTPMALAQADLPELRRFTFFVSRRFEEGRERFRLHMGYFATLAEAEEWLGIVREIYPGAWAGEAPGRKLRERAAAAAAAQAQHAAGPQTRVAARPAAAAAPIAARGALPAGLPPSVKVPVLHAATAPNSPPRVPPRAPVIRPPVAAPAPRPAAAPAAKVTRAVLVRPATGTPRPLIPAWPSAPTAAAPTVHKPAPRPAPPAREARPAATGARSAPSAGAPGKTPKGAFEDSNVREVLAALGETSTTGETRLMRAPPPPSAADPGALSDTQVLRVLENRGAEAADRSPDAPASSIPLLKPDDTGTRRALKEAVVNNAPVAFAVQLQWSVQPVALDKVPPLAIFSAYTLYTVEGSREGRRWFGLRLGFFSDAISAKQVAYYVRSEFASVAVVPVSPQERARASDDDQKAAALATSPAAKRRSADDEIKLIDTADTPQLPARPEPADARQPARPARPVAAPRGRGRGTRVGARERRGEHTLEETLEILGASELTIDDGRGEILNDTGVRHLRVEVQKNSPFSRLLERLSERMKKP